LRRRFQKTQAKCLAKRIDDREKGNRTVTIAVRWHSVLEFDAAVLHAVSVHGHENTPGLRDQIKSMLKDECD
jgi:hypothetical protein